MNKIIFLLVLLCLLKTTFCNDEAGNSIPFTTYFKEIVISDSLLKIKFKESGSRFVIFEDANEIGVSKYNDELIIERKDKKKLEAKGVGLEFQPMDINNFKYKKFENLKFPLNGFVIFESIDLRSFGKELQNNIIYLFPKTKENDEIKEKMKLANIDNKVIFGELGLNHLVYIKNIEESKSK